MVSIISCLTSARFRRPTALPVSIDRHTFFPQRHMPKGLLPPMSNGSGSGKPLIKHGIQKPVSAAMRGFKMGKHPGKVYLLRYESGRWLASGLKAIYQRAWVEFGYVSRNGKEIDLKEKEMVEELVAAIINKHGEAEATAILIDRLNDPAENGNDREIAAEFLGVMKAQEATIPLIGRLNDRAENVFIREAAAEAMGTVGAQEAIGSLINVLKDPEEIDEIRAVATRAFVKIDYALALEMIRNTPNLFREVLVVTLGMLSSDKELTDYSARKLIYGRPDITKIDHYSGFSSPELSFPGLSFPGAAFPVSIIQTKERGWLAVRFDDPRANENSMHELDPKQDQVLINQLYPEWRIRGDLKMFQERLGARPDAATEERLKILIKMAERGLAWYEGRTAGQGK